MQNEKKEQQMAIADLQQKYAITDVKLDHLTQSIVEIKSNHLVHINDQLTTMNSLLNTKFESVSSSFAEVYKQIAQLSNNDAKQEPNNNLFTKIIEYIVLGLIGLGIAFIASR